MLCIQKRNNILIGPRRDIYPERDTSEDDEKGGG